MNIRLAQAVLAVIKDKIALEKELGRIPTKQEEELIEEKLWKMAFPTVENREELKK